MDRTVADDDDAWAGHNGMMHGSNGITLFAALERHIRGGRAIDMPPSPGLRHDCRVGIMRRPYAGARRREATACGHGRARRRAPVAGERDRSRAARWVDAYRTWATHEWWRYPAWTARNELLDLRGSIDHHLVMTNNFRAHVLRVLALSNQTEIRRGNSDLQSRVLPVNAQRELKKLAGPGRVLASALRALLVL